MRCIEALKDMTTGEKARTVFMPYEASSIPGSVGTIKEPFKETSLS